MPPRASDRSPSSPTAAASRFWRVDLRLRTKLAVASIALAVAFVGVTMFLDWSQAARLASLTRTQTEEKAALFEKLLALKGQPGRTLAKDYTYWDDMVTFAQTGSRQWALDNIDPSLQTFNVSAAWVYRLDDSLAYSVSVGPDVAPARLPIPSDISRLFARGPFAHFFLHTPQGLLEIHGATIHPTKDPARRTPARGYFFVGQLWDDAHRRELANLVDAAVRLAGPSEAATTTTTRAGLISFSRALRDWAGRPVARVHVQRVSPSIAELDRASRTAMMQLLGLLLVAWIVLSAVLMRAVVRPLRAISDSVAGGDPAPLGALRRDRGEFGRLAEMMRAHFEQKAQLESASAAKSEFLSRVSHELRTPLNSILGFGQLLAMQDLPSRQRQGVEQILRGGHHLLDLINEVLDISRIETGRMTLSVEPVEIDAVVGDVIDLAGPLAAERAIEIHQTNAAGIVLADRQRLKQILLNLVANAVKYNREGGWVRIGVERAGDRARVVVEDSGHGLSDEQIARLFRPFDRLGAEGSGIEGTGLGLALSKGLAEAMGGRLGVSSERGVGSRFWLELPAGAGVAVTRRPADAGVEAAEGGAPAGAGAVLYIEDNPANVQVVEWALDARPGLKLITAVQGRLGVELARRHRPKLILLDLHLPDMAGHDVLDVLRSDARTRDIPVVVLSADATEAQIARLKAAGAREYLTKPLDIAKLQSIVDTCTGAPEAVHA